MIKRLPLPLLFSLLALLISVISNLNTVHAVISHFSDHVRIFDDKDLEWGGDASTSGDIRARYDEAGDNRLEWSDGTNLLQWLTDAGTTGTGGVTGVSWKVGDWLLAEGTGDLDFGPTADPDAFRFEDDGDQHIAGNLEIIGGSLITPSSLTITPGGSTVYVQSTAVGHTRLSVKSNASGYGDPEIILTTDDEDRIMSIGIDNGSSNIFRITDGNTSGGTNRLTIDTSGNVVLSGNLSIDTDKVYKINNTQITTSALSNYANIGMLNEAETIAANWVNTAYPWADNEVANDLTLETTSNGTFGNASTDTYAFTGRMIVRTVNDGGMDATPGTQAEIVFNSADSKFYGCTVTHETAATWIVFAPV